MAEKTDKTVDTIKKYYDQLEKNRKPYKEIWEEIAEYIFPGLFIETDDQDKLNMDKIYDTYPMIALQNFSDGLQGYLVSRAFKWFKLRMEHDWIEHDPEVKYWLQETESIFYSEFQRSNFYEAMGEYFKYGGALGTAGIYLEENVYDDRILFTTIPPEELFIEENIYGEVDTVFRFTEVTGKKLIEKFGKDKIPDDTLKDIKEEPFEKHKLLHAVFPRDRLELPDATVNKEFASFYILYDEDHRLRRSGYDMNPYAVWRLMKSSKEAYGRGPGFNSLNDIKLLNKFGKTRTQAAQLNVEPPMIVDEKMKGRIRITPRGMNYVKTEWRRPEPLQIAGNYPVTYEFENSKRQIIDKHFMVEFFLMLSNADKQMTAREIIEKQGEKAALLSSVIGKLYSECLNPVFDRVFYILMRANKIPQIPRTVLEYARQTGGTVKIDYLGPLAQAQKRLFGTQGIMNSLESIIPIAQMHPEIWDNIDIDQTARELLDFNGMPQKLLRDPKFVEQMRQQRAQVEAQRMQLEQQAAGAKIVKDLNEPVQEGSIVQQIQNQAAGAIQ